MFESLGVTADEEAAYLAVLRVGRCTPAELARAIGRRVRAIAEIVSVLEDLGFLARVVGPDEGLVAVRPEVAVPALISRRTEEFAAAQAAALRLAAEQPHELRTSPDELIEVVVGRPAVAARFIQLTQSVSTEMLVLDRPPYAQAVVEQNVPERQVLDRGVAVRGIYATEAFELPGAVDQARASVQQGEEARVHADVPMKLAIADRSVALLPLAVDEVIGSALLVRAPTVVRSLVALFELLWQQSVPLLTYSVDAAPDDVIDADLLALLGTGMKDEAIARELGISTRTLGRRNAALLAGLGVRTRFQAGVQAAHRGLVQRSAH